MATLDFFSASCLFIDLFLLFWALNELRRTASFIPREMIYNLCEEMLITHVARPRSPFTPPPYSPRDKRSFIRLRGGRMASSCEAKPKWRSVLAGVTQRPHERSWQRPLGTCFWSATQLFMCSCAPLRIFSQLILWPFVKTGSYDWLPRGPSLRGATGSRPNTNMEGKEI